MSDTAGPVAGARVLHVIAFGAQLVVVGATVGPSLLLSVTHRRKAARSMTPVVSLTLTLTYA